MCPGWRLTTPSVQEPPATRRRRCGRGKSLGTLVRGLGRKKGRSAGDGDRQEAAGAGEPPDIVGLCDEILETAFTRGASDIHIDPEEKIVLVQLRVDGELETLRKLPKSLHSPVVSRFKVLSNMDIAERRDAAGRAVPRRRWARSSGGSAFAPPACRRRTASG